VTIGGARSPCDDGVVLAAPAAIQCDERQRRAALAATVLGSSVAFLDGSMVNVALPAIQRSFEVALPAVQWVFNAYVLLLAALILAGGALGDRYGRRRGFVAGLGLFAAASLAAAAAPDIRLLQVARAAQGIGGALLVPNSLALLAAAHPPELRGRAIGTWAAATAVTAALGAPLGGLLVDLVSWRPVFLLTPLVALAAGAIALLRVPADRPATGPGGGPAHLDLAGAALSTAALAALAFGLMQGPPLGWRHPAVVSALAAAPLLAVAFAVVERRSPEPLVPAEVVRSPAFRAANLLTLLLYFALSGTFFFLPFHMIQVQGWSATAAGAAFLPMTLLVGGLSRWSGGLFDRFGARLPLVVGPLVAAVGFALFAVAGRDASYWTTFLPAMVVLGFGLAVAVAPLTTVVMEAVPERFAGTASGVNNATSRVASMLAVAVLGAVALVRFRGELGERLEAAGVEPAAAERVLAGSDRLAGLKDELADLDDRPRLEAAIDEAFVATFRRLMLVTALLAVGAAVVGAVGLGRGATNVNPSS
jgi:EmrB/QacA subfamily drug resistance transporter